MNTGRILVVTGPPASGKTTVARLLADHQSPRSVHLHADDFSRYIISGYIDPWLAQSHDQNSVVMTAVCGSVAEFARGGYAVMLDGILGPWFLPTLISRCPLDEFVVDYLVLLPPLDLVLSNLAHRTGHGFRSVEATEKMYDEFSSAVTGFERHLHNPAEESPEQTAAAVEAARANGRLQLNPYQSTQGNE